MKHILHSLVIFMAYNDLFIHSSIGATVSSELKLIHRHGDRTPIQCYPTDPYSNDTYWADGWGELTPRGKQRMYGLGKYLRKRYQDFLSSNPREVQIRSSAADRCLESVALVMAGLYRPEGRWQWNNDLGHQWQPFPIQTEPRDVDGMLNSGSKCLAAEQELTRIHNSPEYLQYVDQSKDILNYVSSNTGLNITDLNGAEEVFDTLLIEKENGYPLPRWASDATTYEKLSQISDMTFYFDFSTQLVQRLRTGLLLKDIIKHMNETVNRKHDTQLALLLNALNVFDRKSPPFGSTIMIELRQSNGKPMIEMFYLNNTESEEPIALTLPNCMNATIECHFQQFVQSVNHLIPGDWNQECHNNDSLSLATNTGL
ncbi:unnamed protein product [Oppiella nova]|uniref:Lysosomal acid phosphatase n=1 Tax=Oppiella nova TaxID=334625 RepID=A0A7R9QAW6_9ACAR|nr:unnamed protein product [Oppiella nova]CAG2161546.1 unnamed protein product [Oppiella nova]